MIWNKAKKVKIGNNDVNKCILNGNTFWETEPYKFVEFLKSTGTQCVLTDIVPTYSMYLEADVAFSAATRSVEDQDRNCHPFGYSGAAGSWRVKLIGPDNSQYETADYYIGFSWRADLYNQNTIGSIDVTQRSIIKAQRGTSYWDSRSCQTSYECYIAAPTLGLSIFGTTTDVQSVGVFQKRDMYLYSFKIGEGQTLLHELVPAERQSDGELGLYDTITEKFYPNAGTGTFIKGGYI